jgi:hypothetical protein
MKVHRNVRKSATQRQCRRENATMVTPTVITRSRMLMHGLNQPHTQSHSQGSSLRIFSAVNHVQPIDTRLQDLNLHTVYCMAVFLNTISSFST